MHPSTRARHRSLGWAALALALALLGAGTGSALAAEPPPGPTAPAPAPDPVDAYATYQPQSTCDPTVKPGAQYLMTLLLAHYGVGRSSGITRACSVGGTSEHKEGRALDWALSVDNPAEKAAADSFVLWLTAPGPDGKVGYNARRLGVMHVIWNRQIWSNSSASAAWRPYTGPVPHTDHVHVSLSWAGAYQRSSWWTGVALPTAAITRSYVSAVYRDLFAREPDPAGLTSWTLALTAGTPRGAVANSITASAEYRSGLIRGSYVEFLGREPEAGGSGFWLAAMNEGMTIQRMEAGFLASQEYYDQSGGTDDAWVRQLYRHVLQREAADGEVLGWLEHLAAGHDRGSVAMGFLLSTERLATVVNGYYLHLLGRDLDPSGRQSWVAAIQAGTRTEAIIGGIVASEEYYVRAQR
ncbi:DUF4214 domain-containing protein [Actinotalea sp.]|uniref:DUF4214 domain-containing protein n=1 Tax=Actinotalea sp. TaxID=1872145 RepID=UPI002BED0A13|nr:DUF4214 domain-containing protein [Actinotalea sp.]HRA50892.1 DUF4214 domain-containing protein [Actinotalea sp.]